MTSETGPASSCGSSKATASRTTESIGVFLRVFKASGADELLSAADVDEKFATACSISSERILSVLALVDMALLDSIDASFVSKALFLVADVDVSDGDAVTGLFLRAAEEVSTLDGDASTLRPH